MADFVYKLVKDIHSLRTITVDQYGQHDRNVPAIVHGNYATMKEARHHESQQLSLEAE